MGAEEDSNLANEMPGDTGFGTILPPPLKPGIKVQHANRWFFFSFFLLTILLLLLAILIPQSPFKKAYLGLLTTSTSTSTSTPTPSPGTPTVQVSNTLLPPTPQATATNVQPSFTSTLTPPPIFIPSITPTPTATFGPTPTSLGGGYGQIAFATDRNGKPQIFFMNADGNDLRWVTNMNYGACQPDWSPDGAQLVFISPCPKRQDQYPKAAMDQYPGAVMYVWNADDSGVVGLVSREGGDFDPAWSPDGKRIAFTSLRGGSPQIYILNLGDNNVTRLTEASSDVNLPDWSMQPAWSPSGKQIVFTGHSRLTDALQIWVMSDTGQNQKNLVPRRSEFWNFLPAWSPDGKTILFSETTGAQELGWSMLFDYEHQTVVPLRMQAYGTHGDYSPDGIWIAYESKDNVDAERLDYDIYRIKADGTGEIKRLTNALTMEFDPVWRPISAP
jgi:Tol biopolymer transport system component